jgi:hypothetical protein
MDSLNDTLYYALQGLETRLAMQYNRHLGWSCRQIVRTGIEVAQTMLGDEDVEDHKDSYYTLISRRMCSEPRETMMVIIVMRVLFGLIENDSQARRCRSTFAQDWCDEIEDIYYSYRRAVDEQIDIELTKQPNQTFTVTVMKTEQPQPIIKVFGNFIAEQKIDIHDNQNVYLGATCQPEMAEDVEPEPSSVSPESNSGSSTSQKPDSIIFTKKAKKEAKEAAILEALQESMQRRRDKTRAFVEVLHGWQKDEYIDAHYNAQVMYDELNKLIPLSFGYEVFKKHYNKTRA